ncbi:hypothetical protein DFH09DRAFT_1108016 [Mycena vulgaris]|nr:hypothetical protein DFH09DRAFT_1108016 [Mycena vulgaris]
MELGPREAVGARFTVNLSNPSVEGGGWDERAHIWRARDQGGATGERKSPSGRGRKGCNGILTSVNNSYLRSGGPPSVHGPDECTRRALMGGGVAARSPYTPATAYVISPNGAATRSDPCAY